MNDTKAQIQKFREHYTRKIQIFVYLPNAYNVIQVFV